MMMKIDRVNAHNASAILVQMTEEDREEYENSEKKIKNGATTRLLIFVNAYFIVELHCGVMITLRSVYTSHCM